MTLAGSKRDKAKFYYGKKFNPASTEKFFFEFWTDFSICFPLRPLELRSERNFFLSLPEVWFLDATRFVRLVLAGVRVSNFLNIAKFDLIFLHNTNILYVCLFVGLFVIRFCLSCLSVCLYVCLMYSTVYVWISVFLYICLFFSLFQYYCTVRLSVCLSVYVCTSLFLFVCMYICIYIVRSACKLRARRTEYKSVFFQTT